MTQGAYRILNGPRECIETFVAAPGPSGWRYFGRVHEPGSEQQLYAVDHVVDADWRTVRFRLLSESEEQLVEPAEGGLRVAGPWGERAFEGAELVWSPSPWSVHVLAQFLNARGAAAARGVHVALGRDPRSVPIEVRRPPGTLDGVVTVGGRSMEVRFGVELPDRAEDWFERSV